MEEIKDTKLNDNQLEQVAGGGNLYPDSHYRRNKIAIVKNGNNVSYYYRNRVITEEDAAAIVFYNSQEVDPLPENFDDAIEKVTNYKHTNKQKYMDHMKSTKI